MDEEERRNHQKHPSVEVFIAATAKQYELL